MGKIKVFGHEIFYACIEPTKRGVEQRPIVLIHGFPSASFDYHKTAQGLADATDRRVVVFDHLGFGFSDKPRGYPYSLFDHAERALELFAKLGLRNASLVSHDMGDSVLTEIITRRHRKMLPAGLSEDFASGVVFTNGGMRYHLIAKRPTQLLLQYDGLGSALTALQARLPLNIQRKVFRRSMSTVWGKQGHETKEQDIRDIFDLNS